MTDQQPGPDAREVAAGVFAGLAGCSLVLFVVVPLVLFLAAAWFYWFLWWMASERPPEVALLLSVALVVALCFGLSRLQRVIKRRAKTTG